ncbi:MAG: LPS export ABC transporter periplasmic protein LptC [Thiolinea sp.]
MKFLLVLVSVLLVVILLHNLEDYLTRPEPEKPNQDYVAVDYYLSEFSLSAITATGAVSHTMNGLYLAYSQDTKVSNIVMPRITSKETQSTQAVDAATLTADEAVMHHDTQEADLNGNVRLHMASQANNAFDLQTSFLHYRFADQQLSTDQAVSITSPQLVLQGTGLEAKLDAAYLRLNSNVKSIYQAAP